MASRGDRPGVGEHEHRAAGRDRLERRVDATPAAEHDRVDRPVGRAARPARVGIDREDLVAAPLEHGPKSCPMNPCPTTGTRPARNPVRSAQDASERLDHRPARVVQPSGSSTHACARTRSAKPPGPDRRRRERLAGGLVPGQAPRARRRTGRGGRARRGARRRLRHDLVPEHDPRERGVSFSTSDHRARTRRPARARPARRARGPRRARAPRGSTTTARTGVS